MTGEQIIQNHLTCDYDLTFYNFEMAKPSCQLYVTKQLHGEMVTIDESAYLIGYSKLKTFLNIHVSYLRNSILLIAILISLEVVRELPITLILRPFNFETFATTAYIYASQDLLEAAAVPSLCLIIIASFFILLTSKYILRDNSE